jgi:hypothetical protein
MQSQRADSNVGESPPNSSKMQPIVNPTTNISLGPTASQLDRTQLSMPSDSASVRQSIISV